MVGAVLICVAVVLVLPPLFLISGMVFTAVLGWVLKENADETHAGSELIDLNT